MARAFTALVGVIVLGLIGCGGSGYYEPNPPLLLRTERTIEPQIRTDPTVVLLLVDVQVPDRIECTNALDGLDGAISAGIEENAEKAPVLFLTRIFSGFQCEASGNRSFDVARVEKALNDAANAYPSFAVRPVVIYLNNLDLPLPLELRNSLKAIRNLNVGPLALQPRLWGITLDSTKKDLPYDEFITWTFAADPALAEAVTALAKSRLPHWSVKGKSAPTALLSEQDRANAVAVKLCAADAYVETDFPPEAPFDRLTVTSPNAWLALPEQTAVSANSPLPRKGRVELEVCVSSCDRFETRGEALLGRWNANPSCAEATTP